MLKDGINLEEVLNTTNGKLLEKNKAHFTNISTDSREIKNDELFIPLVGESFNGHKFVDSVFSKGAGASLIQKGESYEKTDKQTIIEVENTLKAYQQLGNYVRKKLNPFVIGITGSSGKTSTKEIAYAFFNQFLPTYKSEANFNNEIGVPRTLLQLTEEHKVAIVEMGMRGKGQIEELALIAEPDAGIITGIGSAHIELLGSKQGIAEAKWELAEFLNSKNKFLTIPIYDNYLKDLSEKYNQENLLKIDLNENSKADLTLVKAWVEDNKQYFTYKDNQTGKTHNACLSVLGKHQISNALLVLSLGKILNIKYPDFIDLSFENLSGRSESIKIGQANFLNDSYNANPESMKAGIETFLDTTKGQKILVIGEMRELGEHAYREHYEIGEFCTKLNFGKLVVIGENAIGIKEGFLKNNGNSDKLVFCADNKEAAEYLKNYLNTDSNIFLKASRGAKLEEIISYLK